VDVEEAPQKTASPEAPVGVFEAKCDEKGRLKLPVRFAVYLKSVDERFFITTLDMRIARIYPETVWKSNQIYFNAAGADSEAAEDVSFVANLYGDFSTIDESGRILVPTELRRLLEFEKQSVWLAPNRGHIRIYGKSVYTEMLQRAQVNLVSKVRNLDGKGMM
jgi:DNA-binding transcriptional regulator/RsmH inhibitor MraZ